MATIDYDEAHKRILDKYMKHGQRVEEEQNYLKGLEKLGIPLRAGLVQRHERFISEYLARGAGVWEALQILATLKDDEQYVTEVINESN